mgnify:CR=1 FL=1
MVNTNQTKPNPKKIHRTVKSLHYTADPGAKFPLLAGMLTLH